MSNYMMGKFSPVFPSFNLAFVICMMAVSVCGCNSTNTGSQQNVPADAGAHIVQALEMVREASYGGTPLKDQKSAEGYASQFPEAVSAIKDGKLVVIWGRHILENAKDPQIIVYESEARSGQGWAIKEDGQLHKVGPDDLKGLPKSSKK